MDLSTDEQSTAFSVGPVFCDDVPATSSVPITVITHDDDEWDGEVSSLTDCKTPDVQGIPWDRMAVPRRTYRQRRIEQHRPYRSTDTPRSAIFAEFTQPLEAQFFSWFRTTSKARPTAAHFQLRHCVLAPPCSRQIVFTSGRQVHAFDPVVGTTTVLLDVLREFGLEETLALSLPPERVLRAAATQALPALPSQPLQQDQQQQQQQQQQQPRQQQEAQLPLDDNAELARAVVASRAAGAHEAADEDDDALDFDDDEALDNAQFEFNGDLGELEFEFDDDDDVDMGVAPQPGAAPALGADAGVAAGAAAAAPPVPPLLARGTIPCSIAVFVDGAATSSSGGIGGGASLLESKSDGAASRNSLLFVGGVKGELLVKNLRTGEHAALLRLATSHNCITNALTLAPHRRLCVSNNESFVRVFEIDTLQAAAEYRLDFPINHASFAPSGKLLCCVGDDTDGLLLDSTSGVEAARLRGHLDFSFSTAWHPSGLFVATANQDGSVRIYDVRNTRKAAFVVSTHMGEARSVEFSHDGRLLAIGEHSDFVSLVDFGAAQCARAQAFDFFGEVTGVAFSGDDAALFIGSGEPVYTEAFQAQDGGCLIEMHTTSGDSRVDSTFL